MSVQAQVYAQIDVALGHIDQLARQARYEDLSDLPHEKLVEARTRRSSQSRRRHADGA